MKKINFCMALLCLILTLVACGQKAPTWQEQYDLGVHYLSEGNYEEAVIAFTAAIEIDSKQVPAYVGRGDAHVNIAVIHSADAELSEDARAAYESALEDYLKSIELDQSLVDIYGKAADVYLALGDKDSAADILDQGYEATNDEALLERRQELGVVGSDEVIWTDPIFEQMVRTEMGLPDGPVYVRDLDAVETLDIFGDQFIFVNDTDQMENIGWCYVAGDSENTGELLAYYGIEVQNGIEDQMYKQRGGITSVDSLRYFRNLRDVFIIANHIADISVLQELDELEYAGFWANDIADLSPLDALYDSEDSYADSRGQFLEIGDVLDID